MDSEDRLKNISEAFPDLPWNMTREQEEEHRKQRKERLEKEGVPQVCVCPVCKEESQPRSPQIVLPENSRMIEKCPRCKDQERKERDRRAFEDNFYNQIPPRYRAVGPPTNQDGLSGTCTMIYGGYGTGKTYEAYALCKDLYFSGSIKTFRIMTELELLSNLKEGYSSNSFGLRLKGFKDCDFLVVDEVGKNISTDFNRAYLFEILNHRYEWMKKTILICNAKNKDEIRKIVPPAVIDRYREKVIEFTGTSRRYRNEN